MIKVEKLQDNCIAIINGNQRLLEGQLITREELETLDVQEGTIIYSVDEKELRAVPAKKEEIKPPVIQDFVQGSDSDTSLLLEASNTINEEDTPIVVAEIPEVEVKLEPKKVVKSTKSK